MAMPTSRMISTTFYRGQMHDVCEINGSKFALFSAKIENRKNIFIDLADHNVVFLSPLQAENNIYIKAISVIVLSTLTAKKGEVSIEASEKIISLVGRAESLGKKIIAGKDIVNVECIKERLEMILCEFNKGILNTHIPTIVDAFVETFDAIDNPSGEKEIVDVSKALQFFNVPFLTIWW